MRLFPAIDIQAGHCVRLRRGVFANQTVFSTDPVEVAQGWVEKGARRLHVVDLDGARLGTPQNFEVVRAIAEAVSVPVQLGGGLRSQEALRLLEGSRVSRIIVGTSALTDEPFLRAALERWGANLVVSVDAENGYVTTHGWQKVSLVSAVELAKQLGAMGVREILYTDIARDGMMAGMNLKATAELARLTDVEVIASGGVTTLDDLRGAAALEPLGVTGVIVGRALYEGAFTLAEAQAAVGEA